MNLNSNKVRQTFGIASPLTGKLYSDILDYYLLVKQLNDISLLPNATLTDEFGDTYQIHMDSKLRNLLKAKGLVTCIISMQKRTTGNFAECRIFQGKSRNKAEGHGNPSSQTLQKEQSDANQIELRLEYPND